MSDKLNLKVGQRINKKNAVEIMATEIAARCVSDIYGEDITVSDGDFSANEVGVIVCDPDNKDDKWFISNDYIKANYNVEDDSSIRYEGSDDIIKFLEEQIIGIDMAISTGNIYKSEDELRTRQGGFLKAIQRLKEMEKLISIYE